MSMNRRRFLKSTGAGGALLQGRGADAQAPAVPRNLYPGVWKFSFGAPEKITPVAVRRYPPAESGFAILPGVDKCPVAVNGSGSKRAYLARIPLAPNEVVYGLGLQLQSTIQRGLKKKLRVNADPRMDTGDSHAPAPFYVTTGGYGSRDLRRQSSMVSRTRCVTLPDPPHHGLDGVGGEAGAGDDVPVSLAQSEGERHHA
jgi:alpha-D-xyloside xylohydrolase